MPQRREEREVCSHLLHAFWAGELIIRRPSSGEPMQPRDLLQTVFLAKSHPGFDISASGVSQTSSSEEQPDGGVLISFHGHIALPDKPSDWTDQAVNDAIDVLRVQSFDAFSLHFRAGVFGLSVHRDDFKVYCLSLGYPLPSFWFGRHTTRRSSAKAERDCAEWLRSLGRRPKEQPKTWYREEAYRRFPGLSLNGFNRAWNRVTPKSWRRPGASRRRPVSISASTR
jgi:hypothetical protein